MPEDIRMRRILLTATALAIVATTIIPAAQVRNVEALSCDDVRGDDDRPFHCEIREESVTGSSLDVDAGANGGIRVQGTTGSAARVRMRVVAVADSEARAREIVAQVRLVTPTGNTGGRVFADGPELRGMRRNGRGERWDASLEVQAPQQTSLSLRTTNGGIAIRDYRGRAEFRATNGGVTLSDVGGDIRGRTTNGGVNIDLTGSRWDGAGLDIETTNGGVRMRLPAAFNAVLETGTVNGGIDIDFPVTIQGRLPGGRNRRLTTTVGDGGARLRVVTTNGGVTIARR
jgi:hypothetical protein